jgi:exopolysaccharide production protein ExoZ
MNTPNESPAGNRLMLIDCSRGMAALLVAIAHGIYFVNKPATFSLDPFHGTFRFGARAVDFFFVLSGFVIAYVHWSDLGRPKVLPSYFAKRFIRVYPILWIVAIPTIVAALLIQTAAMPAAWADRAEVIFGSLTLLPTHLPPVPIVVWTLKHEILFYALYAIVLWRPRVGAGLFAAWAGLCLFHTLQGFDSNFITDFLFSPYNLEFMLGVGCGYSMRKRTVRFPLALALLGTLLFFWAGVVFDEPPMMQTWIPNPTTPWQVAQFGFSSALIILGLSQLDLRWHIVPPKLLVLCGAASYSIYLVHLPVISLAIRVVKLADRYVTITPAVALALVVLAGVVAGIVVHLLVERPILKISRRALLPAKASGRESPV